MKRNSMRIGLATLATLLAATTAQAQLFRAYLAPSGNDANPCTLSSPCRLLPKALTVVAAEGEIWMLDSANYNTATVNVTKSVTILAVPGAVGSVVATGGPAISIATPGVKVTLRNLVIVPLPGAGGTQGVAVADGSVLTVEKTLFANLPGEAIIVNAPVTVRVSESTFRDNQSGLWVGGGARATVARSTFDGQTAIAVMVFTSTGGLVITSADVADSSFSGNATAMQVSSQGADSLGRGTLRDCTITGGTIGVQALSTGSGAASMAVTRCVVTRTTTAAITSSGSNAKVWAHGNTVTENETGLRAVSAGLFESAGDNAVRNNTSNTSGTITPVAKQ